MLTKRHGTTPIARDDDWSQMVAIPVPVTDGDSLRARLYDESGIEIAVTRHAGQVFVRLSVQGYTTGEEIERLLSAAALR